MDKTQIIERITSSGLVVVVRADSPEQALTVAEACREGGAAAVEITFTVPGALGLIERLASRFAGGEILIGAGTVLDPETARAALLAGARFIVSPHFDPAIVELCHRYRAPVMPGTMSVTEIVRALQSGADLIKVFPGDVLGPQFLRAVRGPLPHAPLSPSGGVTLENVGEWIDAGAVALSVGRPLMAGIDPGDSKALAKRTAAFLERIATARAR
jgi:2-dehydro-3-deoxyphosphogluconate aldolase / (4S)-4-hydroxy-2-oxoglutarate aldolase